MVEPSSVSDAAGANETGVKPSAMDCFISNTPLVTATFGDATTNALRDAVIGCDAVA